ncbi:MAG: efflux RND transporter permease subunit, partial [Thioalkalivibrio sp.]|nr:efflux RND transporter permease subunit [Thioalkalivibrio sp.]
IELTAATDLNRPEEFERLIVREDDGALVRIEDIATVELGSENYDTSVRFNGQTATFVGIELSTDANALDVIAAVREVFRERVQPQLPEGLNAEIVYDSTDYIQSAIDEVILTIGLALGIVLVVIYLFLGSLRSVLIPAVAIPLALIGTFLLMLLMGFSINLLTLLAMVLAIGIVVDDAIIMLENVHRHIEDGMQPYDAAIQGARELAWPIVAMSTTLIAVFLPIGFVGGLTGTLFVEFAFTLAGAVLISGVVALTLSPVMCSKILRGHEGGRPGGRLESWLDARFNGLQQRYRRRLHGALNERFTLLAFGLIVLVSCYFLFISSDTELEPPEDQGFVFSIMEGDAYLGLGLLERNTRLIDVFADEIPELQNTFIVNGFGGGATPSTNAAIAGFVTVPWDQRERATSAILEQDLQPRLDKIPALSIFAIEPPSLPSPGGGGAPVSMVLGSTGPIENLGELADEIISRTMATGRFIFMDSDLDFDKPRVDLKIDRDKGVIPQVQRSERLNPDQLGELYTRTREGEPVPLSNIVTLEETVVPRSLQRFQQLNAVTLSGVPRPGVTLGEALGVVEGIAAEVLPLGYNVDYSGQSRQLKAEGAQFVVTFFFALVVIYLVLAAQFESFRDPLIMLMTVPMSIAGALVFTSLGFASLNIYTQVGLVTLIGLIAKHGILIVEFANQLQAQGRSMREAIEEAASLRLRPILMTTAATVIAMVPLLIAAGAGAGSRFAMGLVIASGMTIGTLFTLFVVPAVYLYLARDRSAQPGRTLAADAPPG